VDRARGAFSRRAALRSSDGGSARPAGTELRVRGGGVLSILRGILVLFCPKKDMKRIREYDRAQVVGLLPLIAIVTGCLANPLQPALGAACFPETVRC
jgi:hypothetical protein